MNTNLDLNDHARLRQNRDRNLGFPIGHYIQPPPLLFNRDGLNIFTGDLYKGRSAFLILSGPSFGELIKGETNFNDKNTSNKELLKYPGFVTMSVNNSPKTFRPDLWCIVDSPQSFMKSIWLDPKITKFVPFDHAEKRIFDNESWKEMDMLVGECPNTTFFRRNEHFVPDQFLTSNTINWGEHTDSKDALGNKGGRSVMLVALRLLYHLGIRKVFLLGCDFNMDDNSKYHFEQDRSKSSQRGNNATYEILKSRFEALLPYFDKAGFKVFNCNENSRLKVFPYMPFEDAIKFATDDIPNIETERTSGLYDRLANQKKQPISVVDNKVYTAEEKASIQEELNRKRKFLNDLKNTLAMEKLNNATPDRISKLEAAIVEARKVFRDYEALKNKAFGIIK